VVSHRLYGGGLVLCYFCIVLLGCAASSPLDNARLFADPYGYAIEADQFGRYRVHYPDGSYTKIRFDSYNTAFTFIWKACEIATEAERNIIIANQQKELDKRATWKLIK